MITEIERSNLVTAVKGYVLGLIRDLLSKIADLEEKIASIPTPQKGDPGPQGPQGEKGESVIGPPGKDGKDGQPGPAGKDAEVNYQVIISELVKQIPVPKDGKDGAAGPKGDPGESITGPQGPAGPPGESVKGEPGRDGKDGIQGPPGPAGESIKGDPGKDGAPGRDALQIDVLPSVDPKVSYPRGIFARFEGGIIRSFRNTVPVERTGSVEASGWEVAMNGIADLQVSISEDCRTIRIQTRTTEGEKTEHTFAMPVLIYRGVWAPGAFNKGDVVTWGGSAWHSQANDNKSEPGKNDDWKLMVKEGRRGKDGPEGKQGPPGTPGKNGKDIIGNG